MYTCSPKVEGGGGAGASRLRAEPNPETRNKAAGDDSGDNEGIGEDGDWGAEVGRPKARRFKHLHEWEQPQSGAPSGWTTWGTSAAICGGTLRGRAT